MAAAAAAKQAGEKKDGAKPGTPGQAKMVQVRGRGGAGWVRLGGQALPCVRAGCTLGCVFLKCLLPR